jgi:hypothetical protein
MIYLRSGEGVKVDKPSSKEDRDTQVYNNPPSWELICKELHQSFPKAVPLMT